MWKLVTLKKFFSPVGMPSCIYLVLFFFLLLRFRKWNSRRKKSNFSDTYFSSLFIAVKKKLKLVVPYTTRMEKVSLLRTQHKNGFQCSKTAALTWKTFPIHLHSMGIKYQNYDGCTVWPHFKKYWNYCLRISIHLVQELHFFSRQKHSAG